LAFKRWLTCHCCYFVGESNNDSCQASRLLFTGELITGTEAHSIGLVSQTDRDPLSTSLALAKSIACNSFTAVSTTTTTIRALGDVGLENALQREAQAQAQCYAQGDLREGLDAIAQKRSVRFI
jgi:enoyl-CoA hydratase